MNDAPPCLSVAGTAASRLRVAVVPNARRTGADGLHDGALRVRLNAPPVDGKANDTLVAWLADELDLPKRAVRLTHGQTGRRKTIELDAPPEAVAAWLARVLGA
ncbi:DUF167 domain-containing protein [Rubrivivax gelatinosus]|uniref:DUF167 domain-containing protein n=1 Tax=Rubrivivax gelatinosus TaxID=28068 RepID=UPI0006837D52|nr:DUF167 domain-containing protein [Rubrivivax gelatinosus]MBG6079739.1 uncharacterized protein (TIGR00251 family) [Rubrivivax gelatinosus]